MSLLPYYSPPPSWKELDPLVLDTLGSAHSRRTYQIGLADFRAWWEEQGRPPFRRVTVQAYRTRLLARNLAPATINARLSILRRLAAEAAENGLLAPEVATAIARVRGVRRAGVRAGRWLSGDEVAKLLATPDSATIGGKRDRAILALLVGCALRRAEAAALSVGSLHIREGRWVILDLAGKGGRLRTVPVPGWVKAAIDAWTGAAGIAGGPLFRRLRPGGVGAAALTDKAIAQFLSRYAVACGLSHVAPHDLRRTCARLCRAAGGELEQIQYLLGHASVETTERYLGSRQNLAQAPNDAISPGPGWA